MVLTFLGIGAGVEVLQWGQPYRGANQAEYQSNPNCKYLHPYTVGFRSRKTVKGLIFESSVEEGKRGPVFKVSCVSENVGRCLWKEASLNTSTVPQVLNVQTGNEYRGTSPTGPWSQHCDYMRARTGSCTRVSGKLQTFCFIKSLSGSVNTDTPLCRSSLLWILYQSCGENPQGDLCNSRTGVDTFQSLKWSA